MRAARFFHVSSLMAATTTPCLRAARRRGPAGEVAVACDKAEFSVRRHAVDLTTLVPIEYDPESIKCILQTMSLFSRLW